MNFLSQTVAAHLNPYVVLLSGTDRNHRYLSDDSLCDNKNIKVIGSFLTLDNAKKSAADHAVNYLQGSFDSTEMLGHEVDTSCMIEMRTLHDSNQFEEVIQMFYKIHDEQSYRRPHTYRILHL